MKRCGVIDLPVYFEPTKKSLTQLVNETIARLGGEDVQKEKSVGSTKKRKNTKQSKKP